MMRAQQAWRQVVRALLQPDDIVYGAAAA